MNQDHSPLFKKIITDRTLLEQFLQECVKYLWNNPRVQGSNNYLCIDWKNEPRLNIHPSVTCDGEILFNTASGNITVGENSFFGQRCMLIAGNHDITKINQRKTTVLNNGYDIIIGSNVFIGAGSIIIGPCNVGNNAVIGAGSVVVAGNYDANCLYAGNPAVYKKKIKFD